MFEPPKWEQVTTIKKHACPAQAFGSGGESEKPNE